MYIGGGRFSADVELLNVADGSRVWNRTIPGIFGDILSVQGEIAEDVVKGLKLELSPEEKDVLQRRPTGNSEAFRIYAIGRGFYARRTPENIHKAIEYYERAIRLDPEYALAYSGLADAYTSLYDGKAREAAAKAIALDDELAEAHTSLAEARLELDWDWTGAEQGFKRALALDPNYAIAHHWYGRLLIMLGRHDESLAEIRLARELDPTDIAISRNLGVAYLYAGQTDSAIRQLQEAFKMDPDFPQTKDVLCMAYFHKSMLQDILELCEHDEREWPVQVIRLLELFKYDRKKALELLDEYESGVAGSVAAWINTLFGERERVLSSLERGYRERDPNMEYLKVMPAFAIYRPDPRFQDLLKRMKLE
jgi:tetratricopeptide (TPR) repeat protein